MSEIASKGGMKLVLSIGMILVILAVVYYFFFRGDSVIEKEDKLTGCIKVNRDKFPVEWQEENVPGGTVYDIAKEYLEGDPQPLGSVVGGFFKGINTYPSKAAAKYYKSQLIAHSKSNNALPYWSMTVGELSCKN